MKREVCLRHSPLNIYCISFGEQQQEPAEKLSRECWGISACTESTTLSWLFPPLPEKKKLAFTHHWCRQTSGEARVSRTAVARGLLSVARGLLKKLWSWRRRTEPHRSERRKKEKKKKKIVHAKGKREPDSEWITTKSRRKTSRVNSPTTKRRYVSAREHLYLQFEF